MCSYDVLYLYLLICSVALLPLHLSQDSSFFSYPRVPPCRALNIHRRIKCLFTKLIEIENYGKKHLRINSKSSRLASGAHFPSVFKTAISFKVFIVGISVFSKTGWKLNSKQLLCKTLNFRINIIETRAVSNIISKRQKMWNRNNLKVSMLKKFVLNIKNSVKSFLAKLYFQLNIIFD